MDHAVLRIKATEWADEVRIQTLDKLVADAHCVVHLSGERAGGVQHPLIVFDSRGSNHLPVGSDRCLADVLKGGMGLIAVPQAQLLENALADLLEPELQNLHVDEIDTRCVVDLGVGEVERRSTEGDRSRVEARFKDLGARA